MKTPNAPAEEPLPNRPAQVQARPQPGSGPLQPVVRHLASPAPELTIPPFRDGWMTISHPVEIMRFTLVYDGPLSAKGSGSSRVAEKHAIRKQFHKQLLELWATHPALHGVLDHWRSMSEEQQRGAWNNKEFLMQPCDCSTLRFVPLVTKLQWLICELDILFLRAEDPGKLFTVNTAGDLDNRLKVLFDALRVPKDANELPVGEMPPEPTPPETKPSLFCLLEDDGLITTVKVASERLLYLPPPPDAENYVRLVINVTVKASKLSARTLTIGGDD